MEINVEKHAVLNDDGSLNLEKTLETVGAIFTSWHEETQKLNGDIAQHLTSLFDAKQAEKGKVLFQAPVPWVVDQVVNRMDMGPERYVEAQEKVHKYLSSLADEKNENRTFKIMKGAGEYRGCVRLSDAKALGVDLTPKSKKNEPKPESK